MSVKLNTDGFQIALQKGIERGFAPPTPTALYFISRSADSDVFTFSAQVRPLGTPQLGIPKEKALKVADHAEALVRLFSLLSVLPVQYPGVDDIYGQNISILYVTGPGAMVDFARSGPGAAACNVPEPPTEEQKALFSEAVGIIDGWAKEVNA